jgi:hypothetical protein
MSKEEYAKLKKERDEKKKRELAGKKGKKTPEKDKRDNSNDMEVMDDLSPPPAPVEAPATETKRSTRSTRSSTSAPSSASKEPTDNGNEVAEEEEGDEDADEVASNPFAAALKSAKKAQKEKVLGNTNTSRSPGTRGKGGSSSSNSATSSVSKEMLDAAEKSVVDLQTQLQVSKEDTTKLQRELKAAHDKANALESELSAAHDAHTGRSEHYSSAELQSARHQIATLSQSQEDLEDRLRRQQEESERLRDLVKARDDEISKQLSASASSGVAVAESQGMLGAVQYEVVRLQREKELLESQVKMQQADLVSRTNDLSRQKAAAAEAQQQLQHRLQEAVGERDELADAVSRLRLAGKETRDRVSTLEFEISELQVERSEAAESGKRDMQKVQEHADLHKRHFDAATRQIEALTQRVADDQAAAERALAAARDDARLKSSAMHDEKRAAVKVLQDKLEAAEAELKRAVAVAEAALVPVSGASAPSSAHKHKQRRPSMDIAFDTGVKVDGMGMSELYARVVDAERGLQEERDKRVEAEQYVFCYTIVLPFFLVCGVFVSLDLLLLVCILGHEHDV